MFRGGAEPFEFLGVVESEGDFLDEAVPFLGCLLGDVGFAVVVAELEGGDWYGGVESCFCGTVEVGGEYFWLWRSVRIFIYLYIFTRMVTYRKRFPQRSFVQRALA